MQGNAQESTGTSGNYKWAVVGMLWLVCFFNYADRVSISSVYPLLKQEMSLDSVQVGIVGSAFMWVYAAASPFAGFVGDRFSRKTLILGGFIFWSLVCSATAWSTEYSHLVFFRALEGLGEAFYFPASMSLLSSFHGKETRSRAMAIHQSGVYLGTIAGGSLGGWMGEHYGWRSSFHLLGLTGAVLGLALWRFLREPTPTAADLQARRPPQSLSEWGSDFLKAIETFLTNPLALLLMVVFVGANAEAAVFLSWLPTFINEKFKLNLGESGFNATAYLQIGSFVGVIAGGWLADRLSRRFRAGRMATQALGLFLGAPFIFLAGSVEAQSWCLLSLLAVGISKGLYDSNLWASLHDCIRPERRASAVGLMNALGWLGGGLAATAMGRAKDSFGLSAALSTSSLGYVLVGILLLGGIWFVARRGRAV